jgi:drug/metabolite transporter (DMT)-like permease
MLCAVLFWGVNYSVIKVGLRELAPDAFNGWRLLMTAVLLLGVLALSGQGFRVSRKDLIALAALGVVGNTIYQIIFIHGIQATTAANSGFILSTSPIFVALIGAVLRIERIPPRAWLGILVSFVGLYLVIALKNGGLRFSSEGLHGDALILIGTVLWAGCTVLAAPFLSRMSSLKYSALTVAAGTLAYIPLTWRAMTSVRFSAVSWTAWGSLVFSGIFALVLGYIVWYYSVQRVGNARTAAYNNLTPLFGAVFAALILGERLKPAQAAGAAIVLLGIWLTRSGRRTSVAPEA